MATNADGKDEGADDADQAPEDLLRAAKYPGDDVESSKDADETSEDDDAEEESDEAEAEDDGQTDDEAAGEDDLEDDADADSDEDDSYVKEFPNIKGDNLPDYTRNLEQAYKNSTSEALRLKGELDKRKADSSDKKDDAGSDTQVPATTDPTSLYMKQKMDEEISKAYSEFSKSYGQVNDPVEYQKFVAEVGAFSESIFKSQNRLASPQELYKKAAISLGWEPETTPTGKDKLKVALKDGASISKTSSATKKVPKSKVTDTEIALHRKLHGSDDRSDADIRKELEVYA